MIFLPWFGMAFFSIGALVMLSGSIWFYMEAPRKPGLGYRLPVFPTGNDHISIYQTRAGIVAHRHDLSRRVSNVSIAIHLRLTKAF